MLATDQQVQTYVNERLRPHAELVRSLIHAFDDNIAAIDSVYAAVSSDTPTWKDARTDGPPNLLGSSDVLAFNAFMHDVSVFIKQHPQYPIVLKSCVRPPLV